MLNGKKFVIGITGSIAAYKIPLLVRLLVREGAEVQVIMTPVAGNFVTPLTLSTLSQRPVIIEPFRSTDGQWNNHVELGRWADAMIFAPVTANTLGKMAHGIADNFVVTAYLSAKCPVFIAPAMDLDMYAHPSTRKNLEILRSYGNHIIEPRTGELASGLTGPGRLEEPEEILRILQDHFNRPLTLHKKKVLVTAGPTYEKIDPVRFVGNYSTGTMGFALAAEAARRGAEVTLVAGPVKLDLPHPAVRRLDVESAEEMYRVCMKEAPRADMIIMAAAVADYTCPTPASSKMKKKSSSLTLELTPTKDILREIGRKRKAGQVIVGFALETGRGLTEARGKLATKNLDFIVLNSLKDKGAGFGTGTNRVTILGRSGAAWRSETKDKSAVAADILDHIIHKVKA